MKSYRNSPQQESTSRKSRVSRLDVFDDFGDTEINLLAAATVNKDQTHSRIATTRGRIHPVVVVPDDTNSRKQRVKDSDSAEESLFTEVRHTFSKNRQRQLLSRGVDYNSFMRKNSKFDLCDSLVRIQTEIPGVVTKTVSVKKQLKLIDSLVQRPLAANPVIGISSYPSDLRAKNLALYLMNRAFDYYLTSSSRRIRNKAYPLWHRVYGGFGDSLRDTTDKDPPCFLVIANCDVNSTPVKLEKIRDLLDKYSDIPRVVVSSSCDPLTFFATKLHFLITVGFYLGPELCYREV
jgi:hypothetical protein